MVEFVECSEACSSSPFLQRFPFQLLKHVAHSRSLTVAIYYPAGSPPLYFLERLDVFVGVWVPDFTCVLELGAYQGFVGLVFDGDGPDLEVALYETKGLAGFCRNVACVFLPAEVSGDGDTKVFGVV